jgi:insecticidal toxin complex protein TccC
VLHWPGGKPEGIPNNQIRYSLSDHLGSSTLELDDKGELISQESYYPFGGTSWWAARSAVEAEYKTVRYSGKERDASGLYYYGFRYYAPWLQRWINPDPEAGIDGPNLYRMVRNTPLSLKDPDGLAPTTPESESSATPDDSSNTLEANSAGPVSYLVEGLEQMLRALDETSQGRSRLVAENFTHKTILRTVAKADPVHPLPDKPSKYWNRFEKH